MEHPQKPSRSHHPYLDESHMTYICSYTDITHLVPWLWNDAWVDSVEDSRWRDTPKAELPEIHHWLNYEHFDYADVEKLMQGNIPVVCSGEGTFVGVTYPGSDYQKHFLPELTFRLFSRPCLFSHVIDFMEYPQNYDQFRDGTSSP